MPTPNLTPTKPAPAPVTPNTSMVNDDSLDALLTGGAALIILLSGEDGARSDVRTEFDRISGELGQRLRFLKIDSTQNPKSAERFGVTRHSAIVAWANGDMVTRRNRPWGSDVRGIADELLKVAPMVPVNALPVEVKQTVVKTYNKPVKVTEADFQTDVIDAGIPAIVDFWAEWCGPCKKIAPILEKLAADYAGKLMIAKVNTDENRQLSTYFRIESIPTLMFVKNQKIYDMVPGAYPEASLRQMFDKFIELP